MVASPANGAPGVGVTADARAERSAVVHALARALGFDLVGISEARATPETERLREWIDRGYAAGLDYVVRRAEERIDPRLVLPGARSIIAVGLALGRGTGEPEAPASGRARVARYARGDDYHEVLEDRIRVLAAGLDERLGPFRSRVYVDTGPVHERAFAARAGLGWIGKNTLLIHPELGSHLMLGVLLCDLDLASDEPERDHCGTCTACLDACPTAAFPEPGVLDARRCIAYTTIEDPGPIPEALRAAHGDHLFGCDVCQEVCPWNQRRGDRPAPDPLGLRTRLESRPEWRGPALEWVLGLDPQSWQQATRRSVLRRSGLRGLLRNALVAAGNSGDTALRTAVERHASGDDPLLAEHAHWALERLATA